MNDYIFDVFGKPHVTLLNTNQVLKVIRYTASIIEANDGKTYSTSQLWRAKEWVKSRNTIH